MFTFKYTILITVTEFYTETSVDLCGLAIKFASATCSRFYQIKQDKNGINVNKKTDNWSAITANELVDKPVAPKCCLPFRTNGKCVFLRAQSLNRVRDYGKSPSISNIH